MTRSPSDDSDSESEDEVKRRTIFNNSDNTKTVKQMMRHPTVLYAHQQDALNRIEDHFLKKSPTKALVVLPTGAGKTAIAVLAPYVLASSKVLVITPSLEISNQLNLAFSDIPSCVISKRGIVANVDGMSPRKKVKFQERWLPEKPLAPQSKQINGVLSSPLLIMNAQKLQYHTHNQPEVLKSAGYDLVIVDEAHHIPATTWTTILNQFKPSKTSFLFLTATPFHGSPPRRILDEASGVETVFELSRDHAEAGGVIRRLRFDDGVNREQEIPTLHLNGDDSEDPRGFINASHKITRLVRLHLAAQNEANQRVRYHQAMVITASEVAANEFAEVYNSTAQGNKALRAEVFVANTRGGVLEEYKHKKFQTLVVVGRLLEGFDHSSVSVVGIARPIASRILFSQFVGRAVRMETKDDSTTEAVIVSHPMFRQYEMFKTMDQMAEILEDESES